MLHRDICCTGGGNGGGGFREPWLTSASTEIQVVECNLPNSKSLNVLGRLCFDFNYRFTVFFLDDGPATLTQLLFCRVKRVCFKTLVDEVQELEALSKDPGAVVHGKRYEGQLIRPLASLDKKKSKNQQHKVKWQEQNVVPKNLLRQVKSRPPYLVYCYKCTEGFGFFLVH